MSGVRKSRLFVILGVVSALVMGAGITARSAKPKPVTVNLGPVSFVTGETPAVAVVSVSNWLGDIHQPKIQILDHAGAVLAQGRPSIEPGASAIVSVQVEHEGLSYVRGRVVAPRDVATGLSSVLQIVFDDGTGPHVVSNGLFNAGFVGTQRHCLGGPLMHLGAGQSLRVVATNLGEADSFAAAYVKFDGIDGEVIATQPMPDLAKAATGSVTFSPDTSTNVRPFVSLPKGARALLTLEMVSNASDVVLGYSWGIGRAGSFIGTDCSGT